MPVLVLVLLLVLLAPPAVHGQDSLSGRLVRGADSVPVADHPVILHRITRDSGVPADSQRTGPDGRFGFRISPVAEEAAPPPVHIVSARYAGNLFFGRPVHGEPGDSSYRVTVYESLPVADSDSLPLASRSLVLSSGDRGPEALDLIEISNPTDRTLVSASGRGVWWRVAMPEGAAGTEVLAGGVLPEDVTFEGGSARVAATIPPGGQRLLLRYRLKPDRALTLETVHPVERFELLFGDEFAPADVPGFSVEESVEFRGERYRRYVAAGLEAGRKVESEGSGRDGRMAGWAFLALGVVLLAGAGLTARRLRRNEAEPAPGVR